MLTDGQATHQVADGVFVRLNDGEPLSFSNLRYSRLLTEIA